MKKKLKSFSKHYLNYAVIGLVLVIFTILSLATPMKASTALLFQKITVAVIMAVSLSLVVGFLGELSLGHAGFMCVGAFVGGKVGTLLIPTLGNTVPTVLISIAVGGVAAMLCGFLIGLPALRLKGDYLAIVTLAFGEIVRILFLNSGGVFGDTSGFATPRFNRKYFFIIIFIMVLVTLFIIQNLIRSKHGRAITAIRDSEIAAKATGINVTKYKLVVFAVAAFFAGIAGVLHSFSTPSKIYVDTFDYNYSIEILVIVVLGGMGSINGSIIVAALITYINNMLQTELEGDLAVLKNLIYAAILIVLVVYNNAPALKNFREKYNLKNLLAKIFKPKHDPSHIHDDEAKWDRVPTKIEMNEVLSVDIQPQMSTVDPDKKEGK